MPENPNPQLHIAVCDDEAIDRQQAEMLTNEIMAAEGLDCSVSTYESATALLTSIQDGTQFHILLLDVMMEGLDGMELAAALRKLGDDTAIIFISSNRELALRGYEVSAARYLAKPLREEQLREALLYCCKTFCEKKEILLPTSKGQRGISLSDILYAEAMERVTKLALTDRTEEISMKFSDLSALTVTFRVDIQVNHISTGKGATTSDSRLLPLCNALDGYLIVILMRGGPFRPAVFSQNPEWTVQLRSSPSWERMASSRWRIRRFSSPSSMWS